MPEESTTSLAAFVANSYNGLWQAHNALARAAARAGNTPRECTTAEEVKENLLERLEFVNLQALALNQLLGATLLLLSQEYERLTGKQVPDSHLWVVDGQGAQDPGVTGPVNS